LLAHQVSTSTFGSLSRLDTSHLRSLASLNASKILELSRLYARRLCRGLITSAGKLSSLCLLTRCQLSKPCLIHTSLLCGSASLYARKLASLCALCFHAGSTIKAKLLCRLFERSLRATRLDVTHLTGKGFFCKRFLYSLTRATERTSLNSLRRARSTLTLKL
jgi:hypothetical protein